MKIVTICGSMRFAEEMKKVAYWLEVKHKMAVLQCVYNESGLETSSDEIEFLNEAHYRKIELSDAIYILDIDGYIGEQVKKEIAFAKKNEKEVIYDSDFRI